MSLSLSILPTINAALNTTTAVLLLVGFWLIKKQKVQAHGMTMLLAFAASALFLLSYLTYHYFHGATRFLGTGWTRSVYLTVLISHTTLAILVVPLVIRTLALALTRRFEQHKRIARWVWPIWIYVSITGVLVYWMLYRVNWALACPACKEFIGSSSDPAASAKLTQGYARSIALLMSAPYLLFAGVTLLILRARRAKQ